MTYDKEYNKRYRSLNKEKAKEYHKKYREENKERLSEYKRQYYLNNRESLIRKSKTRYETKKSDILLKSKEYRKVYRKRLSTKAIRAEYQTRRYRLIQQATPKWANLAAIRSFYLLAQELTIMTGIQYHVDHIIPLSGKDICGLHVETNLRVIPAKENLSKHNKFEEALLSSREN